VVGRPVLGAVLVLATSLAYGPALRGGFVWDDDGYVTENPLLVAPDGLRRIWLSPTEIHPPQYYPLTYTTLWLERRLWGLEPRGYHLTNVVLHTTNALLLWALLARLAVPCAWLAAAVFALHPVHVESVAWVTERKNVLSGAFALAAALVYLRARPRSGAWGPTLAALLFLGAMLSKSVVCTLPGALLVVAWWQRGRIVRRDVGGVLPMLVVAVPLALLTVWMERTRGGAVGPDWDLTLVERVLVAGRALWFYLGKLVWPRDLAFTYPRWTIDSGVAWQWAFPVAAVAVAAALHLLRGRLGRGPLAAALYFGGTLLPALGFFNLYPMRYSFVADHFAYLASIGPIALAAALATRVTGALRGGAGRAVATGGAAALLLALGTLTWERSRVYESRETLWRDTLAKNPGAWLAHNNLGAELFARGDTEGALAHYREALRLRPDAAEAQNNAGNALLRLGKTADAVAHYREALRLRPVYAEAHTNLGLALAADGRSDEAFSHFTAAVRIRPAPPEAHYYLANALLERGEVDEAVTHYREAITLRPAFAEAHYNLANTLAGAGRVEEAIAHYEQALAARPRYFEARNNLGIALVRAGRADEAVPHYGAALALRPGSPDAHYNLGVALIQAGRAADAIPHFEAALRLAPGWRPAEQGLAMARARAGPRAP
jgi:tetratricopeptide (TPR) repeat protein